MLTDHADLLLTHAPYEFKRQWQARLEWSAKRHPYQVRPPGDWYAWMIRAGRGAGKTRTGAEDVVDFCSDYPGVLYGIVAPTFGDGRDIAVEGESGVLAVAEYRGIVPKWNRSHGEMEFPNGAQAHLFSSEKPDRLRGPNLHRAWCDELASWKDAHLGDQMHTTWNNLGMALRAGDDPRMLITTTPRRVKLIQELIVDPDVVETRGTTYDNRDNLAAPFLKRILRYEGTRIGLQEIRGELIEDVEGAYWTLQMIERNRLARVPALDRVLVGVDPSGGAAEVGIVAAGRITSPCPCKREADLPHYAVLADASLKAAPEGWGRTAAGVFDQFEADNVVGEVNYGGDMVESTLRQVRPDVPFIPVRATRGKLVRAEPIAAMYGQHPDDLGEGETLDEAKWRVHHVGIFPELEDEMTTYTREVAWSPNRMDALVWALTALSTTGEPDIWFV